MSIPSPENLPSRIRHFHHGSPLFLFEETFGPLISQSKNIIITYILLDPGPGFGEEDSIEISSVNGCSTPDEFRQMLSGLVTSAMSRFEDFLEALKPVHSEAHIDQVLSKLDDLGNIICTQNLLIQSVPGNEPVYRPFRCFALYYLNGQFHGNCQLFGQAICFKASAFADVWIDVISAACDHLQLIRKMYKDVLADELTRESQIKKLLQGYSLKFNLSVSQIGYLFKMFDRNKLIEVPKRSNPELIEWITINFQSKERETIQQKSLRNKLFTTDLAALDFWEDKLEEMKQRIKEERDRLTR